MPTALRGGRCAQPQSLRRLQKLRRAREHSQIYFHLALSLFDSRPAPRQLRNISIPEPPYVPHIRHLVAPQPASRGHRPQRPADQHLAVRRRTGVQCARLQPAGCAIGQHPEPDRQPGWPPPDPQPGTGRRQDLGPGQGPVRCTGRTARGPAWDGVAVGAEQRRHLHPGGDSRGCGVAAGDQYHRAGELRERVGAGGGLCCYADGGGEQD